ncbi:response regulator transcription factor [Tabrizicola sp.]|uniref:response regulator transcription factor n=1 Tax=Tabrizicola sp. TaxID=2005166 RepID=UPI002FDC8EFF
MAQHVLLIEDEPNIAEAIHFLLTRDGLRVSHVAEGVAALALLRQDPPDMVILDHMLPGLSGLEILTAIRAAPDSRNLPVMMLTARGRDREMAERAGADRFMTKPFSNAEILAEVRAMLGRGLGRG